MKAKYIIGSFFFLNINVGIMIGNKLICESKRQNNSTKEFNHNTYSNKVITPKNIYKLSTKPSRKLKNEIKRCLKEPQNKELIDKLLEVPILYGLYDLKSELFNRKKYLKSNDIVNLSEHNYVFSFPNCNFVIQIAGLQNILATREQTLTSLIPKEKKAKYDSLYKITTSNINTYQHVSRMAHYLRLVEFAHKLKHIKLVKTYLFPATRKKMGFCFDKNYIIIQEKYDNQNIVELRNLPDGEQKRILSHLPSRAIKELFFVIKYAALWDIVKNLMVNKKNIQELWISDFEQPNNSIAYDFFYQHESGYKKYLSDRNCGITQMGQYLKNYAPKSYKIWQKISNTAWDKVICDIAESKKL